MENFCHLHSHTEFSVLDGFGLLTKVVQAAKDRGFPAHAITDHGTASGILQFHNLCRKAEIKPILGCEMYFVDDNKVKPRGKEEIQALLLPYDKETQKVIKAKIKDEDKEKKKRDHITILIKDDVGYRNMMSLVSDSFLIGAIEGGYGRMIGRADWSLLEKYREGLILMTACTSGILSRPLIEFKEDCRDMFCLAIERAIRLKDLFGNDLYIELMPLDMPDQKKANIGLAGLAQELSIQMVATNDCHYISKEDYGSHDVLLCIQQNKTLDDPDRWSFDINDLYMKSRQEMLDSFLERHQSIPRKIIETSLDTTLEVAEKCNFTFPRCEPRLPDIDISKYIDYSEFKEWQIPGGILGLRDNLDEFAKNVIEEKKRETESSLTGGD